ncbi:hypothetical protein [Methylocystis bryophila]|uniref:Uncharacterized protein n=1 Tax=Methylocystis bryophila TaxID=655015 RepID=A0A1W6MUP9_9HYPH|nr:hypothetical protein [Methylocystis bryophila]ARN81314.1 hypothetical protein B1812_09740 [Methylocystis bryophila]BDV37286.1 hypothetical protein DSM21852_05390 [Methylocystis bryophila]
MTAEIAILNKTAVALAADSAVTISAGSREEKIFDSADKLFELSNHNPIGVMLYNGMSFMQIPLPELVRAFREKCCAVNKIEEVGELFLEYLSNIGKEAPRNIQMNHLSYLIRPVIVGVVNRFKENMEEEIEKYFKESRDLSKIKVEDIAPKILDSAIETFEKLLSGRKNAQFVGASKLTFTKARLSFIQKTIEQEVPAVANKNQKARILSLVKQILEKDFLSRSKTGVVIAGFGRNEIFPTLVSYEIDGMVFGHLKYKVTNNVDIDRNGPKARVIPFAQKEMVERFLYGLDDNIRSDITKFCRETIPGIRTQIFEKLDFPDDESRDALEEDAKRAEAEFMKGLRSTAFEKIRSESRAEIEDMVEFMPKPELATMAEALVNLTSIKRRVSRGMETVGGPIDVAVISQSEGFVWVKRKHYFPAELNSRYFERVRERLSRKEVPGGENEQP